MTRSVFSVQIDTKHVYEHMQIYLHIQGVRVHLLEAHNNTKAYDVDRLDEVNED